MGAHSQSCHPKRAKVKKPNKETLEAIRKVNEEGGIHCDSIKDFWEKMGMNPHAK